MNITQPHLTPFIMVLTESIPPRLVNSINVPPFVSTKTTITLNWNVLDLRNNCTIKSVTTECNYSYTEGYGFVLKESGVSNFTANHVNPHIVRLVVSDLSPFTKYICWVWVNNTAGRSMESLPISVFTQEDGILTTFKEYISILLLKIRQHKEFNILISIHIPGRN